MIGRILRNLWRGRVVSAASAKEGGTAAASSPPPAPLDTAPPDFGWRFHGKIVGIVPDRSFRFVAGEHAVDGVLDPYYGNLTALQACLQCGACTANCALAGENSLFPRRQMNLFQMGQPERLTDDPTIWFCYNCGDCSRRCPAGAKPGGTHGGNSSDGRRAVCLSGVSGKLRESSPILVDRARRRRSDPARSNRCGRLLLASHWPRTLCRHVAAPGCESVFFRSSRDWPW